MRTNGQRRPEEIQAEIERTRSDLDHTLHAIEQRLTPGQLVDQGLHYLRDSGANEYLTNLRTTATRDPLPLALVGVGLAWLAMSSRRPPAVVPTTSELSGEPSATSSTLSTMKDKVSQTTQKFSETTQKVSQAAHAARERASRVGASARHQAERLRGGYMHLVNEQPLALGAIGLALGAVLAASTPRTRMEEELIGKRTLPDEEGLERERMDSEILAAQSHSRPEAETRWPEQPQQPGVPPDLGTMPP
jgi:ElaB/YqjD/DUF883 family membrane-anchored ribosome-binding protein